MTVAELIAMLQELPGELPVAVSGYEGGLTEAVVGPQVVQVMKRADAAWYEGELDYRPKPGEPVFEVVMIARPSDYD